MKLMKFKESLKNLIDSRGLKLTDISAATGIPKSTLSEWTAGREPKVSEPILKLAEYFRAQGPMILSLNFDPHPPRNKKFEHFVAHHKKNCESHMAGQRR